MSEEELRIFLEKTLEKKNISEQVFRSTALGILNKISNPQLLKILGFFTMDNPIFMEDLQKEHNKLVKNGEKVMDEKELSSNLDIAFKDLEKALKIDDENEIAFCKFGFWLALREIPIKLKESYMWMDTEKEPEKLAFKNINQRSYIFVENEHIMIEYEDYYNFIYKLGRYAKENKKSKIKYKESKGIPLKEFKEKYKEKWTGIILKEVCDECNSENIVIIENRMIHAHGEIYPSELAPLSRCLDCGYEMPHDHYCRICGEAGEDGLVCIKCSDKYTMKETIELIKKKNEKINKFKELYMLNHFIKDFKKDLADPNYDENINSKEDLRRDLKLMLEEKIELEKEIRLIFKSATEEIIKSEEEIEKKVEKAIDELSEKEFEDRFIQEEELLMELYEAKTGKNPITVRKTLRKDYLKWKEESE